jgi:hypothetical protein
MAGCRCSPAVGLHVLQASLSAAGDAQDCLSLHGGVPKLLADLATTVLLGVASAAAAAATAITMFAAAEQHPANAAVHAATRISQILDGVICGCPCKLC